MRVLLFLLLIISSGVCAADEVEIYGKANTKSGQPAKAVMEFEENTPPPVILMPSFYEPEAKKTANPETANDATIKKKRIEQWSPQNPKPFSISPEKQKDEIENTLYEGGDRIYDVQSFPIKDIGIITKPNIDPTISTYPEY